MATKSRTRHLILPYEENSQFCEGGADPSSRLRRIKSIFTKTYTEAKQLSKDIAENIKEQKAKIQNIESDIKQLAAVKEENDRFMTNIETLIK